jgi:DNA-binding HxlR family transcriptional regulator
MLDVIGGKWKLPIICMLEKGDRTRYSTLKRNLGDITNMMLAQSLKELEASGIVRRDQYNEVPPRVEYTLTEKGRSLLPSVTLLWQWAMDSMERETVCGKNCDKCVSTM